MITEFLKQKNSDSEPECVHDARKLFTSCMNTGGYIDHHNIDNGR